MYSSTFHPEILTGKPISRSCLNLMASPNPKVFDCLTQQSKKCNRYFLAFVGFGSCLDIFTSASELFTAMNFTEFPEPAEFGVLNSQNEFLSEFGYYFQQGAAAERDRD